LYYFDGDPKNTVSVDDTKNWDPASTVKLYTAMYAFDQVARGNLSLDESITIDDKNIAASESYQNGYPDLNQGDIVSLYRLLDQMITQSDNTAYNTLLDTLDRQEITKYIHDLGLTNSSVGAKLNLDDSREQYEYATPGFGPNLITANDYATAFILINGGRIPGSGDLFNILVRQKLNDMIPALLPNSVTVAHKTGELDPYYHDGGIVVDSNSNRRYILSVFSDLGSPNVVAHISNLVYTNDVNEVGNNGTNKVVGAIPDAPIDPLVAEGVCNECQTGVLAASTQNAKVPAISASDLGIEAKDISGALNAKQLPPVLIPADSPFHFLVDIGEKIRTNLNPIPSLKTSYETQNLLLQLSEANNLIKRGDTPKANIILNNVNISLATIAKEGTVLGNVNLQNFINQVSETRFSILGTEVTKVTNGVTDSRIQALKEIAQEARDSLKNIKPYVQDAVKLTALTQTPVIGQVVATSTNSVTVKTGDGTIVTKPVASEVMTRNVNTTSTLVQSPTQIPVGSVIALAGGTTNNSIKPSFILTNIASESANPRPATILKVNKTTNTIVVVSPSGIPQQVDLTKQTIIKGSDTAISLSTLKAGDVIVVHGEPIPATPSGVPSNGQPVPTSVASSSLPGQNPVSGTISPQASSLTTTGTLAPAPSIAPLAPANNQGKPAQVPSQAPTQKKPATPSVIKGNVIKVIKGNPKETKPPAPRKAIKAPNPIPPVTPPGKH